MFESVLKSKIAWMFAISLFAVSLSSAIAFGSVPLPEIWGTYSYDLDYPDGYDGPEDIYLYTGKPLKPKVHIGYSPNELVEGRDYDLSYSNNTNAGIATVIATGKGNYSGQRTYQFTIEKNDISYYYEENGGFDISDDTYAYTGNPITPKVTSKKFKQGVDFDISYSNNINPGKGIVLIAGKGLYAGTIKLTFKIKRLTSLRVKPVYNGTKKIVCTVSHPVIGDVVKLKIGKKSYTKKIKKLHARQTFTFKVPKQKYGKKYTIFVRSKSGSTLKKKTTKVWYTNKLKTGQTKAQVLYNPNWGTPSYKNVYSGYSGRQETWAYEYYDSDGNWYNTAYLYFRNGKLRGWNF